MRILFICHRIPFPPNKGEKIRAFHQLKALASRHTVDVFTLADQREDMAHKTALEAYCNSVAVARLHPWLARLRALPAFLSRSPLTVPYFYSAKLASEIGSALKRHAYDRVFISCSAMAQYAEAVTGLPVVLDLVDVDSDKWTQYAGFARFPFSAVYRREGRCLREYEGKVCEKASRVLVTTEREAQMVREISARANNVEVMANGVDTEFFRSDGPADGPLTVTFTGDMSYFPNQDAVEFFARKALPLIRESVGPVRFIIVGRNPSPAVLRLKDLEGVEVTGFVPDVRTYLAQTHVAIAPFSIAAGIQNKILEAMAYRLPVVATSRTVRGLSREVAKLVDTADEAADFAAKVVRLLKDPDLARQRGMEGRRQVTLDYSWQKCSDQLLHLIECGPTDVVENAQEASIISAPSLTLPVRTD